jgi:phage antirepressor YoqD-like protein
MVKMNELIVREYLGNGIEFKIIDGNVYANATSFNEPQKLANWKRSEKTKELTGELEAMQKLHSLIISENGIGTWIHESLLIDLAQYISVKFRIWVQQQITTLIREGSVSLKPAIPKTYAEALLEAGRLALENERLISTVEQQKPLVEFANNVTNASNSIDMDNLAKLISNNIVDIGRNKLFSYLRESGILMKNNVPFQKYINNGYFKIIEGTYKTSNGFKTYIKTLCTGRGQIAIMEKIKKEISNNDRLSPIQF